MDKFDFIPRNEVVSKYSNEERLILTCKAFLTKHTNVYDGRNPHAPKVGVCRLGGEVYTFLSESDALAKDVEFLFYPTTDEIKSALGEFKKKGYHPFYDTDVCFYGYVEDINQIRGQWTIQKTHWL